MALATTSSMPDAHDEVGWIGRIPVRNLWLLMLYASVLDKKSDLFRTLEKTEKRGIEDNPDDIPNLVAEKLCRQVKLRIQRNLSHGYQSREAVLSRVRGRIDLLNTERHLLLDRGKVACRFDELTVNTARNRYVRAALETISKIIVRNDALAHQCRSLAASLSRMGVTGEKPGRGEVYDRFGRHDTGDQPMVATAYLAFNLALPTEAAGSTYLSLPDREDIGWVRKLFEKGIAGFYDVVLSPKGWRVHPGKRIYWPTTSESSGIDNILPSMLTDIVLDHSASEHRIVIDTKFNSVVKSGQYAGETLRSGYIYQIYAYLRSQEDNADDPLAAKASGLLLHPSVGAMVDESVVIQNHEIRFATVDLAATAKEIREQLLRLVPSL